MRILVMGAGALGSVAGGFLAADGHEVTLVGRAPHMDVIAKEGLRISGIWGEHRITQIGTRTDLKNPLGAAPDVALIAVKSFDTDAAARTLLPVTSANTLACSYQNGLGNAECIAAHFGWERTVGARAIYGARLLAPGHVEVTVIAEPTALGLYQESPMAERVRALAEAMDAARLPTVYTDRIAQVLWAKVAYNCALNPLSALLDATYGELRDTPPAWAIMKDAVRELYAVAHAMNLALEPADAEAYLALLHDRLIPPTAAHYASMHADLRHGHRTEIDALNGAIVRFGKDHGIACPVNATLTGMIRAREHQRAQTPQNSEG